jgi:hypothetical protein
VPEADPSVRTLTKMLQNKLTRKMMSVLRWPRTESKKG